MVVFCLLFQQVALAAYLCPQESAPTEVATMAGHCADMDMEQVLENPALCDKHCNPDRVLVADAAKLSVPPIALPPANLALVDMVPSANATFREDVPSVRAQPPPRLLFCTLLI